jgi:hypothetical protein
VTAYNDTEQVWYKGFSDVSIVWQRRRNGPWPHPQMSESDR